MINWFYIRIFITKFQTYFSERSNFAIIGFSFCVAGLVCESPFNSLFFDVGRIGPNIILFSRYELSYVLR